MITLNETSSRLTIVNHLRQSVAAVTYEPMEVRLAICAVEQSYHLSADECRSAIMSARWTAALIAPAETLSSALRAQVEAYRRREQERSEAVATWQNSHTAEVATAAAKLTAEEIAALPGRIAHHFEIADNGVTGRTSRKRHRQQGRALLELLNAAMKVSA